MSKPKIHFAWWVLGITFVALLVGAGSRFSFGAYIKPLELEFHASRGGMGGISFLSFIVYGLSQPLVGGLVDRYGPRIVLSGSMVMIGAGLLLTSVTDNFWSLRLAFGVIASIGFAGSSSVAASVIAAQWFVKRRGLAIGLLTAAFSLGQMVIVPMSIYLISQIGWRDAFRVLAMIMLIGILPLVAIFLRSKPQEIGIRPFGAGDDWVEKPLPKRARGLWSPDLGKIFRSPYFWPLALPYFICGFTTSGLMDTHLIPFAQEMHMHKADVATTISLLALFNFFGSAAAGYFSDRWDKGKMLVAIYGLRVFTVLFLLTVREPLALMIFGVAFGLVDFATVAPTSALSAELFSGSSLGMVYGWISLSHQLGAASGSFIPGLLYDWTGGYQASFILASGMLIFSCLVSLRLTKKSIQKLALTKGQAVPEV